MNSKPNPTSWLARCQELVALGEERDSYLLAVKNAKAESSKQEKELEQRMIATAGQIANRSEKRPVECRLVFHWDLGKVDVVRIDSEETIDSRAISAEERQQKMPFGGEVRSQRSEVSDGQQAQEPLRAVK